MGRLSDWIPGITVAEVQPLVREALAHRFALRWQPPGPEQERLAIAEHPKG